MKKLNRILGGRGMPLVRILDHGQVTIPKKIREALGLKKGDVAEAELLDDGRIVIVPKRLAREQAWEDLASLFDELRAQNPDATEEAIRDEVVQAVEEYRARKHAEAKAGRSR